MTKQLDLFEGVYFNQSFEDYRAIPAFSRSFAEDILFDSAGEEARYNLENPRETTPAMELGTAIHSAILEPEDLFNKYAVEPKPSDEAFIGKRILFTVEDLKPFLETFGLKKSGKKEELIASLKQYLSPNEFVIWDDVIANFEKELKFFGKKKLSEEHSKIVSGIQKKIVKDEKILDIFSGGYPEVTLVWKDPSTGIFCKCRLDYLRHDAISELKSFSIKNKKIPLEESIYREITNNRYNFQFAIYLDALELLIKKINNDQAKVFGDVDEQWLKILLNSSEKRSFLVFARTQAPYQIRSYEIERGIGSMNGYFSVANDMWRNALTNHFSILKGSVKRKEIMMLEDRHLPGIMSQMAQVANSED